MAPATSSTGESILPTVRLDRLHAGDKTECQKLVDACHHEGFFYLDLTSNPTVCKQWDDMLEISERYFAQPREAKMQDVRGTPSQGYQPIGAEAGAQKNTRSAYEGVKMSRRDLLYGETTLSIAAKDNKDVLFGFMQEAHSILMMMLKRLSDEMGLKGPARFETQNTDVGSPMSNLTLLKYPKQEASEHDNCGHNKHTDVGTLTFLLTKQWGLQVLSNEDQTWGWVEPRPGHAIINVGDSLRFPSRGELASVVHRVVPRNEVQEEDRYSIAYFLQARNDLEFQDGSGKQWSLKQWHDFKFDTFAHPETMENGLAVLTGMMEERKVAAAAKLAEDSKVATATGLLEDTKAVSVGA